MWTALICLSMGTSDVLF